MSPGHIAANDCKPPYSATRATTSEGRVSDIQEPPEAENPVVADETARLARQLCVEADLQKRAPAEAHACRQIYRTSSYRSRFRCRAGILSNSAGSTFNASHYPHAERARSVALVNTSFNLGSIVAVQATDAALLVLGWSGILIILAAVVATVFLVVTMP